MSNLHRTVIQGYEILECIGTGDSGVVYHSIELSIGREVAIKVIAPELANRPDFIQHFEKEAQLFFRLEHPHIVPIYNYWRTADETCLVMRYLRGGNLHQTLQQQGAQSVEKAALYLDQIAAAIHVAHRNNVIHGDLKPENILFDEDGNTYVADFSFAIVPHNEKSISARSEDAIGMPDYLSPEQVRGEPVTKLTDIYALGVLLYEVLAGEHPFPKTSRVECLYRQLNELLPPIQHPDPEISEAINAVLQKATAKDPALRFPDAIALAEAFRDAVQLNFPQTTQSLVETLTLREQEVLQRLIQEKSNQEIAQELYLAVTTIKWYNKQIFRKLRVRNRVQAIVRARELNLLQRSSSEQLDDATVITSILEPTNPYKGLQAFQSVDSRDFFGRERYVQEMLGQMAEVNSSMPLGEANFTRFLAIIGPSGSGKSSLVKAGLIPALWRGDLLKPEHWYVVELVPGNRPMDNLEVALARIAANYAPNLREQLQRDSYGLIRAAQLVLPNDGSELVIVIDQFEEVFTLVRDEEARAQFLNLLVAAIADSRSRIRLVITLRADFYDRPLHYPEFGKIVRSRMITILPLNADELERAIVLPAERVGVSFEPGLVASIIGEVNYQPGALPLLQFTLTELFEHRVGLLMTREAYESIGGAVGALAKQAQVVYQQLSGAEQETARQMFLRLITLGEGSEDTRRRVPKSELMAINSGDDLMDDVIDMYATYRLLSLDHDPATRVPTVEIAHEALIRAWGQLREWLTESREDLRIQRQLMAAVEEWTNANKDPGFLAAGGRLVQFEALAGKTRIALSKAERSYLEASISERVRRENEREVQQKRLLRLQRGIIATLAVFLLTAIGLTVIALMSRNDAISQTQIAFSRQLASQSLAELRNPVGNDEYAALLAIRALTTEYDPVADGALVEAAFKLPLRAFLGHTDVVYDAKFSPDGRYVLTGSADHTARLWDAASGRLVKTFSGDGGEVYAVAFSPDGNYILTGNEDHTARLWDIDSAQQVRAFSGHVGAIDSVAFSPDGAYILTRSTDDGTAILWNADNGQMLRTVAHDGTRGIAFSPDGDSLLVSDTGSVVTLTETRTGRLLQTFPTYGNSIYAVAFSPDGQHILTGSMDNTATLWETVSGQPIFTLRGHSGSVRGVAFSPDGRYIATGSSDHTIRLWDAATGQELHRFRAHLDRVWSVAFSPDGQTLVSASADHTAKLWKVITDDQLATFSGHTGEIYDVAISPDESYVLTGSGDHTAGLWDVSSGAEVYRLVGHDDVVYSVAFSPDGRYALTGSGDSTMKLWDVATGAEIRTFSGHSAGILGVTFSPDGLNALSGSEDDTAKLWEVATGREVRTFSGNQAAVYGVNFSPDGSLVVTAGDDGVVRMWETASGQEVSAFASDNTEVFDADFSPDGKYLLIGTRGGAVRLLDIGTGQLVRAYSGMDNTVYNVAFSADGKYVAAASANRTARIWDTETGGVVRVLSGHTSAVWGIAFSPDVKFVVTGSLDHTADLWQIDYHDFVESVCARLLRDFTEEERALIPITDQDPTCPQFEQQND